VPLYDAWYKVKMADKAGMQVDIYHGGLEHND
jgi:hypothetical protein